MSKLRKSFGRILTTKTKDLGDGIVSVIVSTNTKDRHGEILDIKGLSTKEYSGVVFLNHDYEQLPIGKSLGLTKTADGKLVAKTQFAVEEFDLAATVYKLVKGGYMPDVSIGFIPKKFDPETDTWTESEMIEYSHVGIGANPEAKVQKGLKSIGLDVDEFTHQVKEHMQVVKSLVAPTEEETPVETKGAVADVLNEQAKWEYIEDVWTIIDAFTTAYYDPDVKPGDFGALLLEAIALLSKVADGSYDPDDEGAEAPETKKLTANVEHIKALYDGTLDTPMTFKDNSIKHIDALKALLSAAENELASLDDNSQDTEITPAEQIKRKRIILVRAKKTMQTVDKVAELTIGKINKRLEEN